MNPVSLDRRDASPERGLCEISKLQSRKAAPIVETPRWGVSCTTKDCAGDGPPGRLCEISKLQRPLSAAFPEGF